MPRANTSLNKKPQTKATGEREKDAFTPEHDDLPDSPSSSDAGNIAVHKRGKKRSSSYMDEEDDGGSAFGTEMQKMLECFGADISKTLQTKQKRLEICTQGTLKSSSQRVEETWKTQQGERQKLHDELNKQLGAVFQQWQMDLDKSKEQEEKLVSLFKQQQKVFQQTRIVQSQRLKTIRQLLDQYQKGSEDLDRCHHGQQGSLQSELKKEMSLLQKKILMETQQQGMATFKKSLQSMLF